MNANEKTEYIAGMGNDILCYLFPVIGVRTDAADWAQCRKLFDERCRMVEREDGLLTGAQLEAVCSAVSDMHRVCWMHQEVELGVNWWLYGADGEQESCSWDDAEGGFLYGRSAVDTEELLRHLADLCHLPATAAEKCGWETIVTLSWHK